MGENRVKLFISLLQLKLDAIHGYQVYRSHSPYTKGNFEFERVVRGWRSSVPVLDLRLKR
jgi:hypothetical protein